MIDLKSVVEKYPESLNSAEKLRAYLTDLYPSEKAKVGIVVSIFSCGIADEIKRSKKIDDVTIERFCTRLENDYGYSQKISSECLDLWLKVYNKSIVIKEVPQNFIIPPYNPNNINPVTSSATTQKGVSSFYLKLPLFKKAACFVIPILIITILIITIIPKPSQDNNGMISVNSNSSNNNSSVSFDEISSSNSLESTTTEFDENHTSSVGTPSNSTKPSASTSNNNTSTKPNSTVSSNTSSKQPSTPTTSNTSSASKPSGSSVSSTPSNAEKPVQKLEGMNKDLAISTIEEYGLSLGEIVYVYSNKHSKDQIVCTNFSAAILNGKKVNIVISKGKEPSKFPYEYGNIYVDKATEKEIPYYHIYEMMNTDKGWRQITRYTLEGEYVDCCIYYKNEYGDTIKQIGFQDGITVGNVVLYERRYNSKGVCIECVRYDYYGENGKKKLVGKMEYYDSGCIKRSFSYDKNGNISNITEYEDGRASGTP